MDYGSNNIISKFLSYGQVIEENSTLHSDLNCKKDGLYIGKDDVTIGLNGYTISGYSNTEKYSGIVIPSFNNILIKDPRTISNFGIGIFTTGSENIIINR